MKATCEQEIFKLFQVTKRKGCYSFKLEKNTKRKILKLNIFYLVRFHVDFRLQIRIVYFLVQSVRSLDRDQWAVGCLFQQTSGFHPIQYISVQCKLAQWRVADPVAFYTSRTAIIFEFPVTSNQSRYCLLYTSPSPRDQA